MASLRERYEDDEKYRLVQKYLSNKVCLFVGGVAFCLLIGTVWNVRKCPELGSIASGFNIAILKLADRIK